MKGIFAVYKPKGPTSHDIIDQLRRETGIRRIGHAGTLDPLASGVLVVAVGREYTKRLGEVVKKEKEYLAKIRLGMTSTTDDEEGKKTKTFPFYTTGVRKNRTDYRTSSPKRAGIPNFKKVEEVVKKFQGEIMQTPPIYSAVKVDGVPAYKLARQGKTPQLEPRKILIKKIEILKYEWPDLKLRVVTGPGVYIRALARDIGKELGTGGYLAELERTRVGDFVKSDSLILSSMKENFKQ